MAEDCTFLDKDTFFRGSIRTPDELVVEGNVTGEVEARRQVTILNGASVEGPIRTTRILLEEGAYHLGVLSLSLAERPDSLSLGDLERLRKPSRPTASGRNGNGHADPADTQAAQGSPEEPDHSRPGLPEETDLQVNEVSEREAENGPEGPVRPQPAGHPEEQDDFDRLW